MFLSQTVIRCNHCLNEPNHGKQFVSLLSLIISHYGHFDLLCIYNEQFSLLPLVASSAKPFGVQRTLKLYIVRNDNEKIKIIV